MSSPYMANAPKPLQEALTERYKQIVAQRSGRTEERDGRVVYTDAMGRPNVVYDKSKDDLETEPVRKVQEARKNWQALGLPDPSNPANADFWKEKAAQALFGGGVTVNNIQKAEGKQAETLGTERGKASAEVEAAARNAPGQISRLNLLGNLLEKANTGKLGEAEATVVGWGRALGMSPDDLQRMGLNPSQAITKEAAQKIINELTVGSIGKGGFPANNFSDADRSFLEKIFPSVANQPEANGIALDVMRRVEQRKIEFADAWGDYQDRMEAAGKTPDFGKFEREYRRSLKGQPDMFADVAEKIGQLRSPKPEAGGAPAPRAGQAVKLPEGVTPDAALSQAREAIRAGKDPNAVRERLRGWGLDPSGL
jgi:hypothetical protein